VMLWQLQPVIRRKCLEPYSRTAPLSRFQAVNSGSGVSGEPEPSALGTEDTLNRCGQSRITLTESRLQHSGHRTRIEVFTMRKDTPSGLLERVMPAAGAIQSARLCCPGTNYSERGSTEPSKRRDQTRP